MPEGYETSNFLDLYLYHCGESEIPTQFHLWSCLSMLAACVADRVLIERHRNVLPPNLYVFLIGPSGCGKEKAINVSTNLIASDPEIKEIVNPLNIRATAPALLDRLGKKHRNVETMKLEITSPRVYLITEELNTSIREGPLAQDLLSMMTKLYNYQPIPITEITRSRAEVIVVNPCLNWEAGTTDEWLLRSVPKDAIEGGFFARVLGIRGKRDYKIRCPQPKYPSDYDEVLAHLIERVRSYTQLTGRFQLSSEAMEFHRQWYESRPGPAEVEDEPAWNRADEMIHKVAVLLALCEWDVYEEDEPAWLIESRHLEEAISFHNAVAEKAPIVTKMAASTPSSRHVDIVEEILKRWKWMDRSTLTKKCGNKGMDCYDLNKALATLFAREVITSYKGENGKMIYEWIEE